MNEFQARNRQKLREVLTPIEQGFNNYVVDPLNKAMPGQWGNNLKGLLGLAGEMSPGADVRDMRDGINQTGRGLLQLDQNEALGGLGLFGLGAIGMVPGAGDAAKAVGREAKAANFKKWFGDSKVVDKSGKPLTVYHGSPNKFQEFDPNTIGQQGSSEGYGFYFSDKEDVARGYTRDGGTLIKANLAIKKPLDSNQTPFNKKDMEKIISRLADMEVEKYSDELNDFRDGFLSNLIDTYSVGSKEEAAKLAADMLDGGNDIAIDQIAELANIFGEKSMPLSAVRDVTGYDGIFVKDFQKRGDVYLSWFPEQIKSIHNRGTYNPKDPNILKSLLPIGLGAGVGAGLLSQNDQEVY